MLQLATLHTTRLNLLQITPQVIHSIFNNENKETILSLFGCDEDNYQRLLEMHHKGMETARMSMRFFLLQEKSSGLSMGQCGFHTWNATHRRAEVFYFLNQDIYKCKGYMKEALHAVLHYGYSEMELHRVAALIDDNNTPSKKLLEHYGFTREGIVREDYIVNGINEDSVCYSLLKQEWQAYLAKNNEL
jgi:[ribosomal protein S5]-alanine N-acetyltransferase